MDNIILVGGGGHCKSVIDVIESSQLFRIVGIVDLKENIGKTVLNYPVIGSDDDLPKLRKQYSFAIVTVGQIKSADIRISIYEKLTGLGYKIPVIKASDAYISKHSKIGAGTVIMHGAIINADSTIGCNCIINSKALIEHDATIGDHCHVSTAAVINGGAIVGSCSFIGSNSTMVHYSSTPSQSFIKANSLYK